MITSGIDCGAQNTRAVIMENRRIIGKSRIVSGFDLEKAVEQSLAEAVENAGISLNDIRTIHSTGSGKASVRMAAKTVNDIQAMAKGAVFFFPGRVQSLMLALKKRAQPGWMPQAIRLISLSTINARPARELLSRRWPERLKLLWKRSAPCL